MFHCSNQVTCTSENRTWGFVRWGFVRLGFFRWGFVRWDFVRWGFVRWEFVRWGLKWYTGIDGQEKT